MRKNISSMALMALIALALAPMAFAEEAIVKPTTMPNMVMATPVVQTTEGTVTALALDAQSVVSSINVKQADGKEAVIQIDKTSTVWKAGQKAALADVKVNGKVKIRTTNKEGKETAKTVEIEA